MNSLANQALLRPLEFLTIPEALDGRQGSNRAPPGTVRQLPAENDLQAVRAWLAEFHDSPYTLRNYRKEAERLLLWALVEQSKPLSSLNREDCLLYEQFLTNPQPRERWCGPKAPRFSPHWRPFLGPLSTTSRRSALLIINALFSYLVKAGYLSGNPLALVKRRVHGSILNPQGTQRFLEQELWQALLDTVEALPKATERQLQHYQRSRFLVALLYLLGPRVGEVATHTMGSFVEIRGRWWWTVTGKGKKTARVPVNEDMLEALINYRTFFGLTPLPVPEETTPLVMSLKGTSGISDNMIYRITKTLFNQAAEQLEATDPWRAEKLRRASTHWFRHTSITHQADAGISLKFLQRNARHSKLNTTSLYLHAEDDQWHNMMQRHHLKK
jgi:integrase